MTRRKAKKLQTITKQKVTIKNNQWYLESIALSLILYAEKDEKFKAVLKKLAANLPGQRISLRPDDVKEGTVVLLPSDMLTATKRAEWLVGEINSKRLPGAEEAVQVLKSWVEDKTFEVPKQLIIGIVGVAIIGPTLGLIDKKKTMISVVRTDIVRKNNVKLAKKTAQASHNMLISALESAQGDIRKLEPDVADWFFGEKEILFYSASAKKMKQIEKELKQLGVIYAAQEDSQGLAVLAMSPSVNSHYSEVYWELEAVK